MKKFLSIIFSLFLCVIALPAFALDLQEARSQGLVGERLDGYIEAVQNTSEVNNLVSQVNNLRKQEYERISKENGQPVSVVAKLAAVQIIKKLSAGSLYEKPGSGWQKK